MYFYVPYNRIPEQEIYQINFVWIMENSVWYKKKF